MNAVLVSVNYSDRLALTLPYNRGHFDRVLVVTTPRDHHTVEPITRACGAETIATNAFYDDGADFNKFKALEEGLNFLGRAGWICIMDADVAWPKEIHGVIPFVRGELYTPRRRVADPAPESIPDENLWRLYPDPQRHGEFCGYTQIFHASDPALGDPPWHPVDWRHAGGGDSDFQARWPVDRKVRPPFEVLHLGPIGQNWCGRTEEGKRKLDGYMRNRMRLRSTDHERL